MRPHGFLNHLDRGSRAILIAALSLIALAWYGVWIFTPGKPSDPEFVIATGDSVESITDGLEEAGVVRSRLAFKVALRVSGRATQLQPGSHDLAGVSSYADLIERLTVGGVSAAEISLRIIEGWDLRDILSALKRAGYPRADELYEVTGSPAMDARTLSSGKTPRSADFSGRFSFLKGKPAYVSLEGFLFPDTYRIFRDAAPEEVVATLLANFDRKLEPELRSRIATSGRSLYDTVTMASIVENEVRSYDDRRRVADIFWRRLDAGMALQSDTTVNYVTGGSKPSVSLEETKNVSPYNTYKYPGLPLGPVCNPGLAALKAVIDPLPNQYWYFLTDPEGNVYYGRTYEEHLRNKAKYLR